MNAETARFLRQLQSRLANVEKAAKHLAASTTLEQELERIPGRRVFHTLVGSQDFSASNNGNRGNPIVFEVSQDGPFVMTHYPIVGWRSSLPTNATDFGRWRPVATWPLPDQVLDTNTIDLSYEMADTGSNRSMQNEIPVPILLMSFPGKLCPLPKPTYFRPNTSITFTPTYEDINFGGSEVTTQGTLVVALPGYKIVNLG